MWNVSLAADAGLSDAATQSAIRFARKTIDATSSEWLTTRVLFLNRFGTPEETQTAVQALLAEQNDDGGWGWLRQQDSDAIATGQILWVLHQANQQQAAEQNLHKAVNWLIAAQIEDGSWPTKGTKKNAQDKVVETATFWGSAWATIGLLQTLPVDGTATE